MPGDFEERLAAVDDALDASADSTGSECEQEVVGGGGDWDGWVADDGGDSSVSGGDGAAGAEAVADAGAAADVAALTERVAELEAAVQALRGYAGSVRAVNDRVEERADAAVSTTEAVGDRVDELARRVDELSWCVEDGRRPAGERSRGSARVGGGGAAGAGGAGTSRRDAEATAGGTGERSHRRASGCSRAGGREGEPPESDAGSSSAGQASGVAWPPEAPREPYGDVDADDDRERPGLVARLRDAL